MTAQRKTSTLDERRIKGEKVYAFEDLGLTPIAGITKDSYRGMVRISRAVKPIKSLTPTDEELEAMEAGKRVTEAIRATMELEAA